MRHYDGFNEVRRAAFAALDPGPASTCVGGAQFTTTDVCIEIEAIAVVPGPPSLAGRITDEGARLRRPAPPAAPACTACPMTPYAKGVDAADPALVAGGMRAVLRAAPMSRRRRWPGSAPAPAARSAIRPVRKNWTSR